MAKVQKNMRLDTELMDRLNTWASEHGMTFTSAVELAIQKLVDADAIALAEGSEPITSDEHALRELMMQNGKLIEQLGDANKTAMEAVARAADAMARMRALPSAEEVDERIEQAREEERQNLSGEVAALRESREREMELAAKTATAQEHDRIRSLGWFDRMRGNF